MKFSSFILIFFCVSVASAASKGSSNGLTKLFAKLSDAGIDQVVELPYNRSLIAQIGKQVQVHNIVEMQRNKSRRPEPKSLLESFSDSFEYYPEREVLPELTYKVGKGRCDYMEAIKVSDVLVCYRKAISNYSALAPVHKYGPRCKTTLMPLSHCFIFAHRVDEVVKALTSDKE